MVSHLLGHAKKACPKLKQFYKARWSVGGDFVGTDGLCRDDRCHPYGGKHCSSSADAPHANAARRVKQEGKEREGMGRDGQGRTKKTARMHSTRTTTTAATTAATASSKATRRVRPYEGLL